MGLGGRGAHRRVLARDAEAVREGGDFGAGRLLGRHEVLREDEARERVGQGRRDAVVRPEDAREEALGLGRAGEGGRGGLRGRAGRQAAPGAQRALGRLPQHRVRRGGDGELSRRRSAPRGEPTLSHLGKRPWHRGRGH